MSKPEHLHGTLGRLYAMAAEEPSFKKGYVNMVEYERKLGIGEPKNMQPLLDAAEPERREHLTDTLDTSGMLAYSYLAERLVDGRGRTLYNYTVTTSLEQGILGIPSAFIPDIRPKRLRRVQEDNGAYLSAVAALTYHIRSDMPQEIQATQSYAIKHRGKSLVCTDSDIFTEEGCDGESVEIPTVESGNNDRRHLFIPEQIEHERMTDTERIETHLAFSAITSMSEDGSSALVHADLCQRVETILDILQRKRSVSL